MYVINQCAQVSPLGVKIGQAFQRAFYHQVVKGEVSTITKVKTLQAQMLT